VIWKLLVAWCLMSVCIAVHAAGVTGALRWFQQGVLPNRYWGWTWLLIQLAGWMVLLHLVEISVWALYYYWKGAIADVDAALYFSVVTYTTTGYGDIVLPEPWRLVGGVEALTGILMCGWSTGFFFAVVSRMYRGAGQAGQGPQR
jgi:hypothetical protein